MEQYFWIDIYTLSLLLSPDVLFWFYFKKVDIFRIWKLATCE